MKVRRSKKCEVRSESRGKDVDEAGLRNWAGLNCSRGVVWV